MERVKGIDTARGVLMLYIVLVIHGLYYLYPSWQPVAKSFLLFEMPLLFLISGYSYFLYECSNRDQLANGFGIKGYISFVILRTSRILVPYFAYAVFCILIILPLGVKNGSDFFKLAASWLNPFSYGRGYPFFVLNYHLWFIPVFIIITIIMPVITKLRIPRHPNLLLLAFGAVAIEYSITRAHFPEEDIIKKSFFYLIFTLLGYYIAKSSNSLFKRTDLYLIAATSLILLVAIALLKQDIDILDMQINKFPPNHIFFIFSCFWVSIFLILFFSFKDITARLEEYGIVVCLKPFISCGYSIYLWQGIGYTIAFYAGKVLNIPVLLIWLLAFIVSVALGVLASPAERVKIRLR